MVYGVTLIAWVMWRLSLGYGQRRSGESAKDILSVPGHLVHPEFRRSCQARYGNREARVLARGGLGLTTVQ